MMQRRGGGRGSGGGAGDNIKDFGVAFAGEVVDFTATFDKWTEKPDGNQLALSVLKRFDLFIFIYNFIYIYINIF